MPTLDLPAKYLSMLLQALDAHVPDAEVWAYGSRVKGQAHDGSDLDLVLRNPVQLGRPQERLYALRDALEESNLPILVEVLDWARLPEEFRREIRRSHVVVRAALAASDRAR
jgi:predicted nucleotidyltransferase